MTIKSLIPTEAQEQRALVKWMNYHPIVRNYYLKITNEGKRTEAQGWNLKQQGLRPGVSDLFIYYPTNTYHGLWLEVKRNKKYSQSERGSASWIAQESFLESVRFVGYSGSVCYGWEDGVRIIEDYLAG